MDFIDKILSDAQSLGEDVVYLPHATFPIGVRKLGGLTVEQARELRDQLTAALRLATAESED